jgi:hypothetical protein
MTSGSIREEFNRNNHFDALTRHPPSPAAAAEEARRGGPMPGPPHPAGAIRRFLDARGQHAALPIDSRAEAYGAGHMSQPNKFRIMLEATETDRNQRLPASNGIT